MSELEKVRAIVNDNDSERNNLPEREEFTRHPSPAPFNRLL